MSELQWSYLFFDEIDAKTMYAILKARSAVFVVEQNCVYPDMDGKDESAWHLCGWKDGELAAYVRILPPGLSYAEASIGRVLTTAAVRGSGAGRGLMQLAIKKTFEQFPAALSIRIGAQLYLRSFYTSLGFSQVSPEYLEDGIPHIEMVLTK